MGRLRRARDGAHPDMGFVPSREPTLQRGGLLGNRIRLERQKAHKPVGPDLVGREAQKGSEGLTLARLPWFESSELLNL